MSAGNFDVYSSRRHLLVVCIGGCDTISAGEGIRVMVGTSGVGEMKRGIEWDVPFTTVEYVDPSNQGGGQGGGGGGG